MDSIIQVNYAFSMEFLIPLQPTEIIFSAAAAGITFAGTIIFLHLFRIDKELLYRNIGMLLAVATIYTLFDVLANLFGAMNGNVALGRQFHRLMQIGAAAFPLTIHLIFDSLSKYEGPVSYIHKGLFYISAALFGATLFIAYLFPDLYVSQENGRLLSTIQQSMSVRGATGVWYFVRDIILAFTMLFYIVTSINCIRLKKSNKELPLILLGLGIAYFGALEDTFYHFFGFHIISTGDVQFSRTGLGLAIFMIMLINTIINAFVANTKQLKNAHNLMMATENRFRTIVEHMHEVFWLHEWPSGDIIYLSPTFGNIWQGSPRPLNIQNWMDNIHPDDRDKVETHLSIIEEGEISECLYRIKTETGDTKWINDSFNILSIEGSKRLIRISEDVSDKKQVEGDLELLAFHDPLTKLLNRRSFYKETHSLITYHFRKDPRPLLACVLIDIDYFQEINKSYGSNIGDQILVWFARLLERTVRTSDYVFRIAADEFLILLTNVQNDTDSAIVAEKVFEKLNEPFIAANKELYISISMGISMFPNDGEDPQLLYSKANIALHEARKQHNCYTFYSSLLEEKAKERMETISKLRKTIDGSQFRLYYQPIIKSDGRVYAAEALIRWMPDRETIVNPSHFISIAEETGLIIPIGYWVLEQACKDAVHWQSSGYEEVGVSVNLSLRQFWDVHLIERIADIVESTGIKPELLHLEITESMFMDDISATIEKLEKLRELGFSFSIDDFGTGYSSFSYLKKLPVKTIKIDRSFVMDLPDDAQTAVVVESIVNMARGLNLTIVAEGAENQAQQKYLAIQLGCHIQGYFYSPPIPLKDFVSFMEKQENANRTIQELS